MVLVLGTLDRKVVRGGGGLGYKRALKRRVNSNFMVLEFI